MCATARTRSGRTRITVFSTSAITNHELEIRELSDPTANAVVIENRSETPVLGAHGQLLEGAKWQNRSLNLTAIVRTTPRSRKYTWHCRRAREMEHGTVLYQCAKADSIGLAWALRKPRRRSKQRAQHWRQRGPARPRMESPETSNNESARG